jgi:hypothetical protein
VDFSGPHRQADIVDGNGSAEPLDDVVRFNQRRCSSTTGTSHTISLASHPAAVASAKVFCVSVH